MVHECLQLTLMDKLQALEVCSLHCWTRQQALHGICSLHKACLAAMLAAHGRPYWQTWVKLTKTGMATSVTIPDVMQAWAAFA